MVRLPMMGPQVWAQLSLLKHKQSSWLSIQYQHQHQQQQTNKPNKQTNNNPFRQSNYRNPRSLVDEGTSDQSWPNSFRLAALQAPKHLSVREVADPIR
jgi:hypothetical protein